MQDTPRHTRYHEIADDIRRKIRTGTYPVGTAIPSLTKLIGEYDASGTVVQRALRELKHEGVLVGQPGKAVYVEREPDTDQHSAEFTEIMDQIRQLREALDETAQTLDGRISALERTIRRRPAKGR